MDEQEKEDVGKFAGATAGVLGGARLGSAFIPIPVVGTFAGALAGGVLGSEVGKRVGKAVINGAGAFVETMRGNDPVVDGR